MITGRHKKTIGIGKISGVFGVKGWVKVFSYTEPRNNLLKYSPWLLQKGDESRRFNIVDGKAQGNTIVAQLEGVTDRDQAASLIGFDILITQEQLPETTEGEYYWSDLIGMKVDTVHGFHLGLVDGLLQTGANDVLIVKGERERAIPFLQGQTVIKVDLDADTIIVDWDPEF